MHIDNCRSNNLLVVILTDVTWWGGERRHGGWGDRRRGSWRTSATYRSCGGCYQRDVWSPDPPERKHNIIRCYRLTFTSTIFFLQVVNKSAGSTHANILGYISSFSLMSMIEHCHKTFLNLFSFFINVLETKVWLNFLHYCHLKNTVYPY